MEWPADEAVEISWFAQPALQGAPIEAYRWGIAPKNRGEEKSISLEPKHWTSWSLSNTSATVGPFSGDDLALVHVLEIQARDVHGRIGSLQIGFQLIAPTFARDLLIVDDTRLTVDQRSASGGLDPPRGLWPTAAELDTFLYARGGYPWQYYPAGTMSRPGLFAGYDFDTLGTRGILDGVVPLSVLSRYRHVIWMTDDIGSKYTGSPVELLAPITSLRLMSSPGWTSTLGVYAALGGDLWLCGGGAAYASLAPWQRRGTDPAEFTHADGELVEGRLMYDFLHWRSALKNKPASQALLNHPAHVSDPGAAPGRGWPGQPDYGKLLARAPLLLSRTCATDPPSPLRGCNAFYVVRDYSAEFLSQLNVIVEDLDPRSNHEQLVSTLDTLYVAAGGVVPPDSPVMTYYHGQEAGKVVFSGFPIWQFRRQQCQELVDFVLQDIWGLSRRAPPSSMATQSDR